MRVLASILALGVFITADASATLLGRVNSYYDPEAIGAVQGARAELAAAKEFYDKLRNSADTIESQQQATKREEDLKRANFEALKAALNSSGSELTNIQRDLDKAQTALAQANVAGDSAKIADASGKLESLKQDLVAAKEKNVNLGAQLTVAAKELADAGASLAIAQSRQVPSQADIENARKVMTTKEGNLRDKLRESSGIVYAGDNGVNKAALSSISISTATGGGNVVDLNAYQYTIPLWKADCIDGKKESLLSMIFSKGTPTPCATERRTSYRLLPMYILLHKSVTTAQTASSSGTSLAISTLSNDLLDNEHGGLVNLKFAPSFYDNGHSDPYQAHISVIGDLGYKHVEEPTPDLKSIEYVSAGYIGLGVNLEFSILDTSVDESQLALKNVKPAGQLALGFGVYRNTASGINNTLFPSPIPRYFSTLSVGGELQITDVISAAFSHALPRFNGPSPLGSYSSISITFHN